MFIFLAFLLPIACSSPFNSGSISNVCGFRDKKLHLDLGQSGVITNRNLSAASNNFLADTNVTKRNYCILEIETCLSCLILIKFRYLDVRDNCEKSSNFLHVKPCRCDYIWIAELSYEDVSGESFCGNWNPEVSFGKKEPIYRSQTRAVVITFFYVDAAALNFVIYYTAERNRNFYSGYPQGSDRENLTDGVLSSPFFPSRYPRDLVSEYIISCIKSPNALRRSGFIPNKAYTSNCRIRLVFTDFQLAVTSFMEFFDDNQRRIEVASGSIFRPPVILTNSSRLKVRFTARGERSFGFRGIYSFIQGNESNPSLEPNTDCGGLIEDLGGVITMVNMVHAGIKAFDCIWLIHPPENFFTINGNLYLKVDSFGNFEYAELEVREGLISESPLMVKIYHSSDNTLKELISSPRRGFYIHLKATFGPASVLGITFTSFHYNKCFTGPEYLCHNHRCIPRKVYCDGFDHCGDSSDEIRTCYKDWSKMGRSYGRSDSLTPNYYFPKVERYSELKTATFIFIVSSLGLIMFLVMLIILVYRMGSRSRQQAELQNRLQTITDYLDDAEIEEIVDDEPPLYEAPPDYEAAMNASKQHPINLLQIKGQVTQLRSGDIAEFERMSKFNSQQLPASPPPPYAEDGSLVVVCRPQDFTVVLPEFNSHQVIHKDESCSSARTHDIVECM